MADRPQIDLPSHSDDSHHPASSSPSGSVSTISSSVAPGGDHEHHKKVRDHARAKTRLTTEHGERIDSSSSLLGGPFVPTANPGWLGDRRAIYDEVMAKQAARLASKPRVPITITLPDGKEMKGISWQTTPLEIAQSIHKNLAASAVVAVVTYTSRVGLEDADGANVVNTGPGAEEDEEETEGGAGGSSGAGSGAPRAKPELWDLTRPLEGDCRMELKKFEDKEGKMVFWHSSAHVLGECVECQFGGKLCIGPPTEEGFYYDAYMGDRHFTETDYPVLASKAEAIVKEAQAFERIVLTKEEALRLFADNPFKVQLIATKIPDGGYTTAYRCGPLIDLCRGPHIPTTGAIKAFDIVKHSAAYWLGNANNDSLQRIYGVSFPDVKLMKQWRLMVEEAKKRDHRLIGAKQQLFFFHDLSPGSCFFLPHGTRVYNKLMDYIRGEYRHRGYTEVITPNMFNIDLWRISGHAEHYLENMFTFKVEGADFGLKPMNCPGHCLMFDHYARSYRELPIRLADFGVLHRNEFSGALSGLTRVRRFQQDDAHIFCRTDQIKQEVAGALDFMKATYGRFGFEFELHLSTRPKKAMGDKALWDRAETMMGEALDAFGKPWKLNPGDGAFYGPKIDIKVFDALGRPHQCATIQLDFQLPVRFNLRYRSSVAAGGKEGDDSDAAAADAATTSAGGAGVGAATTSTSASDLAAPTAAATGISDSASITSSATHAHRQKDPVAAAIARVQSGATDDLPEGYERPVMVHRAILGSVERMMAVLIEHTAGKWPLWLSPRQVAIVPVNPSDAVLAYANAIKLRLHMEGFYADLDDSRDTLNKKIRNAQIAQYNYTIVVGEEEAKPENQTVDIRARDTKAGDKQTTKMKFDEAVAMLKQLVDEYK